MTAKLEEQFANNNPRTLQSRIQRIINKNELNDNTNRLREFELSNSINNNSQQHNSVNSASNSKTLDYSVTDYNLNPTKSIRQNSDN